MEAYEILRASGGPRRLITRAIEREHIRQLGLVRSDCIQLPHSSSMRAYPLDAGERR